MDSLVYQALPTSPDELALKTYLARYSGETLNTYMYSMKSLFDWCRAKGLNPLQVKRPILEIFAQDLETSGLAKSTVAHRLGIIRGYYKFAVIDEFIDRSPAEHVKMPVVYSDDSTLIGLEKSELGSLITTAKESNTSEFGMVVLMAILGLRVSEVCSIKVTDFDEVIKGHRVLKFVGKGGKPATIPLPVSVLRILDEAKGTRTSGHLFLRQSGSCKGTPHARSSVSFVVRRLGKKAGLNKHVHPHMLRHSFVATALDAGVPLRDVQLAARHEDPKTTARYDRARFQLDRHAVHTVSAFMAGSI